MLDSATIAAISTPSGQGGLGVIRISGPEAPEIATRIFRPATGRTLHLTPRRSHRVFYGRIVDPDTDVVVVTVQWRHIGATPYVADNLHTSTASAVIIGRPDLSLLAPEPDTTPPAVLDAYVYDTNTDGILDQINQEWLAQQGAPELS